MIDVTEEKLAAIMKSFADMPITITGNVDTFRPEWLEDPPIRDLIQVLHDLVVYMRGDPEFVSYEFDEAERVLTWSATYLERTK